MEFCEVFCAVDSTEDQRDQALAKAQKYVIETKSIADVVGRLGPSLTSMNEIQRSRGTLMLSRLLETLPNGQEGAACLDGEQVSVMLAFFKDRSRDTPCVGEVLHGLASMVRRWNLSTKDVESLLATLFAEVYVQALDQPLRFKALSLVEIILELHIDACVSLAHDFVYGYLQMVDGERDPRNLLLVFRLTPIVLTRVPGCERFLDELFDVTSCYFPISFRPKAADVVTPEMLEEALLNALTASPLFAPLFFPFMAEKLAEPGDRPAVWRAFAEGIRVFLNGPQLMGPYAQSVWETIEDSAFVGKDASTVEEALIATERLMKEMSRDLVVSSSHQSTLDPLLRPLLTHCVPLLAAADSKQSVVAAQLLAATARSSLEAARAVVTASISPLLAKVSLQGPQALLESAELLAKACESAVTGSPAPVSAKAHPLASVAEQLFNLALSITNDSSSHPVLKVRASSVLASLCCALPSLPAAADAAEAVTASCVTWAIHRGPHELDSFVSSLARIARSVPALVVSRGIPFLRRADVKSEAGWLRAVETVCLSSPTLLQEAGSLLLGRLDILAKALASLDASAASSSACASSLLPAILDNKDNNGACEAAREACRALSLEDQRAFVPRFRLLWPHPVSAAALCALRRGIALEDGDALFDAACIGASQPSASPSLGWLVANLCNKRQCSEETIRRWIGGASGWVCCGETLRGGAFADEGMKALVDGLKEGKEGAAESLAIGMGGGGRSVSREGSHAEERALVRQRAFGKALRLLLPSSASPSNASVSLAAVLMSQNIPPAALSAEADSLFPLLRGALRSPPSPPSLSSSALRTLRTLLTEATEAAIPHADALMRQCASELCSHEDMNVRREALLFLQQCSRSLSHTLLYPWKDTVLAGVTPLLDDPRREIRMLAVDVSNKFHVA